MRLGKCQLQAHDAGEQAAEQEEDERRDHVALADVVWWTALNQPRSPAVRATPLESCARGSCSEFRTNVR